VGHVDEFMSFVPTPHPKGFRLVLANPSTAYRVLEGVQNGGHGAAKFMDGKRHEMTVDELLGLTVLRKQNDTFQKFIDWNKAVLIKEMGLQPSNIVYVPALYYAPSGGRADAFFPGMVNMQVVNGHLAIPKPFGPVIGAKCVFEAFVESVFGPLGLMCHFVDTYEGYHLQMGEIHCGTNVVREPLWRPTPNA
jgi:protein-arginine deiminase